MGLDVAIDELYASGWSALDTQGCGHHDDGRFFPGIDRICEEFRTLGYTLTLRHVQLFDCYRAEWTDEQGRAMGAVVGQTETEAAVYALSQVRRAALVAR